MSRAQSIPEDSKTHIRSSLLGRWVRQLAFAMIAVVVGGVLLFPFAPAIIEWWAELPHDRTVHRFNGSPVTFTTWYVTYDPLDCNRTEFWFEVRDGLRVIKSGAYYSSYGGSPALISKIESGADEPFGVYLTQRRERFTQRDCAALVLYDPLTKTVAGRENEEGAYPDLEPTGDQANWPGRLRRATQIHGMLLLQY